MSGSILLVEDDMSVQEATSLLLERAGMHVTGVADGRKALEVFAERHFDVVVLDLMLPSLDGLTVCRELRGTSRVPIVILTARTDQNDIVAGLEAGADDYVTKPFHGPELLARVRAALRRVVPDHRSPLPHRPRGHPSGPGNDSVTMWGRRFRGSSRQPAGSTGQSLPSWHAHYHADSLRPVRSARDRHLRGPRQLAFLTAAMAR